MDESQSAAVAVAVTAATTTTSIMDGRRGDDEWTVQPSGAPISTAASLSFANAPLAASYLSPSRHLFAIAAAESTSDNDVFLCVSTSSSRLLTVLYRLCAIVAAQLASERLQRSTVPAYLALTCQHVQQPVLLLTAKPQHSAQQQADLDRWNMLRGVRGEAEIGWNQVRVQSASRFHTHTTHTHIHTAHSLTVQHSSADACPLHHFAVLCRLPLGLCVLLVVRYATCLENVDSFLLSVAREPVPPRLVLIDELLPPAQRAGADIDWKEAWAK